MKKTKPPKALHSHISPFFPLLPSFFFFSNPPLPSKLPNRALEYITALECVAVRQK